MSDPSATLPLSARAGDDRGGMSEDARRVYALLRVLHVGFPGPCAGRLESTPGFRHQGRFESCPDCLANGRVLAGCETCGGHGAIPIGGRDPYEISHQGFFGDDRRRARDLAHVRDREIERIDDLLAEQAGVSSSDRPTRAVAVRERLLAGGSFAELQCLLDRVRDENHRAYRLALSVAYQPFAEAPINPVSASVVALCEHLAGRMSQPIRVPRFATMTVAQELERIAQNGKQALWHGHRPAHAQHRHQRDQLLRDLHTDGHSTTQLAHRFGLTRQHVQRIVRTPDTGIPQAA